MVIKMLNRNERNCLMGCLINKKIVVSGLVAIFVLVGLVGPAIAQAPTDAMLVMHFDEGYVMERLQKTNQVMEMWEQFMVQNGLMGSMGMR